MRLIKHAVICIVSVLLCIMASGCSKGSKPVNINSVSKGEGKGKIEFSDSEPVIRLYDIVAKVGTDIDYTSKIEIEKEEGYSNFEMWVNASDVDIYEPGTYKVIYTFYYNDKSVSKEIKVTIVSDYEDEPEVSAGNVENVENTGNTESRDILQNENGNTNPANTNTLTNSNNATTPAQPGDTGKPAQPDDATTPAQTIKPTDGTRPENPNGATQTAPSNNPANTTQTVKPTQSAQPTQTTKPAQTTKPTAGSPGETTTTRTFIPAADREKNTTSKDLGYMRIELLSGNTVKVKCTTSRYIVSTRTDVSEITRKGVKYQVSKLIVKFNTGTEQILETSEKRIG